MSGFDSIILDGRKGWPPVIITDIDALNAGSSGPRITGRSDGPFVVVSPDGLPIWPDTYDTKAAAEQALASWVRRFEGQGYYLDSSRHKIPVQEIAGMCAILTVDEYSG